MKVPLQGHRSDRQSRAQLRAVTIPHGVEMPIHYIEQPIHGIRGPRCSRTIIRRQKRLAAGAQFLDHRCGDAYKMRLRPFPQAARPLRKAALVRRLIDPPGFVQNHPAQLAPAERSRILRIECRKQRISVILGKSLRHASRVAAQPSVQTDSGW